VISGYPPSHRRVDEPQVEICELCGNFCPASHLLQSEVEGLRGRRVCDLTPGCQRFRSAIAYLDRRRNNARARSGYGDSRIFQPGAGDEWGVSPPLVMSVLDGTDVVAYYDIILQGSAFVDTADGNKVTKLVDFGPNGYHQTISAGFEPVYVANAGDGLPAWFWDGSDTTEGVEVSPVVALPGMKWACAKYTLADVESYIEGGTTSSDRWWIGRDSSNRLIVENGGLGDRVTADVITLNEFFWAKGIYSDDPLQLSEAFLNGVSGGTPMLFSKGLSGIKTSVTTRGSEMEGYIRATLTTNNLLTAEKTTQIDAIFAAYKAGSILT